MEADCDGVTFWMSIFDSNACFERMHGWVYGSCVIFFYSPPPPDLSLKFNNWNGDLYNAVNASNKNFKNFKYLSSASRLMGNRVRTVSFSICPYWGFDVKAYLGEDLFQHHVLLLQVVVILEGIYRNGISSAACGHRSESDKIALMDAQLLRLYVKQMLMFM